MMSFKRSLISFFLVLCLAGFCEGQNSCPYMAMSPKPTTENPFLFNQVCLNNGTERAWTGALLNNKAKGTYKCSCCGSDLYHSDHKYNSNTGWPSFWEAHENVGYRPDLSGGQRRIEVYCKTCGAHLGHVFFDGPPPTGERHCINSVCMDFIPDAPTAQAFGMVNLTAAMNGQDLNSMLPTSISMVAAPASTSMMAAPASPSMMAAPASTSMTSGMMSTSMTNGMMATTVPQTMVPASKPTTTMATIIPVTMESTSAPITYSPPVATTQEFTVGPTTFDNSRYSVRYPTSYPTSNYYNPRSSYQYPSQQQQPYYNQQSYYSTWRPSTFTRW